MKDILSIIINLRALDMSNINSKGYCLVLCNRKISIIRTPSRWIITVMFNGCIEYVYQFIFDLHDSIRLDDGTIYLNVEEFISNIIKTICK